MTGYIIIGIIIFCIGLFGALTRKEMLRIFISVEIMAGSAVLIFASVLVFSSTPPGVSASGFVFLFFVWIFSIANAAVGLPLFLLIRSRRKTQNVEDLKQLSG